MISSQDNSISVRRHRIPHVETYEITAEELAQIKQMATQVGQDLQFASNTFSIAVSFLIALLITKIDSVKVYSVFVIVTIVGFVFSLYFLRRWLVGRRTGMSIFQRIEERQAGPLGQEGNEIRPAELAELPAEQPSETAKKVEPKS